MKDILTIEEYEEERKRQIVEHEIRKANNLDITIPNIPIPKMKIPEIPGTGEQLQQQYNSEQWEELKESFIKLGKQLIEGFKPVQEALISAWYGIKELLKVDLEIKKCYGIYKRTKKRKDQKKANAQNNKNNRKEIY